MQNIAVVIEIGGSRQCADLLLVYNVSIAGLVKAEAVVTARTSYYLALPGLAALAPVHPLGDVRHYSGSGPHETPNGRRYLTLNFQILGWFSGASGFWSRGLPAASCAPVVTATV